MTATSMYEGESPMTWRELQIELLACVMSWFSDPTPHQLDAQELASVIINESQSAEEALLSLLSLPME